MSHKKAKITDFISKNNLAGNWSNFRIILRQSLIILTKIPQGIYWYFFRRQSFPIFLRKLLLDLGPVYIKLGQVFSTRSDIFPATYLRELSKLRESCPMESKNVIVSILKEAYPSGIDKVFAEFNDRPIAAGTVAQVHIAKLHSGEKVAVKILRPGIKKKIEDNFKLLIAIVNFSEQFSIQIRTLNIRFILEELHELLLSQTNLIEEANNYLEFQDVYRDDPILLIPKVYKHLSSFKVMVMEYVEGIMPYQFEQLDINPLSLASKMDDMVNNMIFVTGLCHADLHPGNFFWNQDGKIILVDLGLVHKLDLEDRNHITTFYFAIFDGFYDFATDYLLKYFVINHPQKLAQESKAKEEAFKRIYELLQNQFVETGGRPKLSIILPELIKIMAAWHLQFKPNFSKVLLTLATVEGYLYALDPTFDIIENWRRTRLDQAEYASIPLEAEQILVGDYGTYSTAIFEAGFTTQQAWVVRDRYVLDRLEIQPEKFLIDVGCGRGKLLQKAKERGARVLGITISRLEYETCQQKGLDCLWNSWEEFSTVQEKCYPKADAMAVIEMFVHLASFHENKSGLLDKRLQRFFAWANEQLKKQGKLFIQSLNIATDFIHDSRYQDDYQRITSFLPWIGFTTLPQIIKFAEPYFEIREMTERSSDILNTYYFVKEKIAQNEIALTKLIKPDILEYMKQEMDVIIELAERRVLSLSRILMQRRS